METFQERRIFFVGTFLTQKKLTLPLFRCRYSRRRDPLGQILVLLCHFIHRAKHIWAQTPGWSEHIGILVYRYIGIYQYTNIPIYLTCSDHPGVWCRKYLARWMKWHSSSRFPSRLSLLWESWQPNKAKVKVELTKVTRVTEVNFGSKFFFWFSRQIGPF